MTVASYLKGYRLFKEEDRLFAFSFDADYQGEFI